MVKPKISFVVPSFNSESYLAECLNALIKQTLKEIEIIVVDDGSTDNTETLVKWFVKQDKRIKYNKLPKNVGRSEARNIGNLSATADIICVQDADDISAPNRAEEVLKYFKKHHKINVVHSAWLEADMYSRVFKNNKVVKFSPKILKKHLLTCIAHSTMAYRKKLVESIKYEGGVWADLGLDDWRLQVDMWKKGEKFGTIDKFLLLYRHITNSVSHTRDKDKVKETKLEYLKTI